MTAILAAVIHAMQPYGGHATGWTNPWVVAGLVGGAVLLAIFLFVETRVPDPMFDLRLFRTGASAFFGG